MALYSKMTDLRDGITYGTSRLACYSDAVLLHLLLTPAGGVPRLPVMPMMSRQSTHAATGLTFAISAQGTRTGF